MVSRLEYILLIFLMSYILKYEGSPMSSVDKIPSAFITLRFFKIHFSEVISAKSASTLLVKLLFLSMTHLRIQVIIPDLWN